MEKLTFTRHIDKLLPKAKACDVSNLGDGIFSVLSPSGKTYEVNIVTSTCNCDWHAKRTGENGPEAQVCSHVLAVWLHCAKDSFVKTDVFASEDEAKAKHEKTRYIGQGVWVAARSSWRSGKKVAA